MLLGGIPTLITILGTLIFGLPEVNPIAGHFWTATFICGIGILIFYSTLFGFWNGIIPGAIGGAICAGLLYAGFRWFPSFLCLILGAILILGAFIACYYLFKREKVDTGGKSIRGDEFEYRQLDSLYYAYHQQDDTLDNVITKYSEWQQSYNKTNKENISFVGWRWVSVVWVLFALWYFITPQASGSKSWTTEVETIKTKAGKWVIGKWEVKYASGSTCIVCNIDSVANGETIFGTMAIAGQAPVKARGLVHSKNDTLPSSFSFYPENNGTGKQLLQAEYNKREKEMEGYYNDRKGISHQIIFLTTPLETISRDEHNGATQNAERKKSAGKDNKPTKGTTPAETETSGTESENLLENEESPVSGLWKDTM